MEADTLAAGRKKRNALAGAPRLRRRVGVPPDSNAAADLGALRTDPRVYHRYRHDRLSVISGLSVSPGRRRVGLYFRCHRHNIRHPDVCDFFRHLLRHLRGQVIAVLDNASIHKGEAIRELCRRYPRLHLESLPPYTPELNPDEGVWADAKARLANGRPDDLDALYRRLYATLRTVKQSPSRLRRWIHQSELSPLFRKLLLSLYSSQ